MQKAQVVVCTCGKIDSLAVLCGCSDSQMYRENIQCPVMFKNELCAVHYINGQDKSKLKQVHCVWRRTQWRCMKKMEIMEDDLPKSEFTARMMSYCIDADTDLEIRG